VILEFCSSCTLFGHSTEKQRIKQNLTLWAQRMAIAVRSHRWIGNTHYQLIWEWKRLRTPREENSRQRSPYLLTWVPNHRLKPSHFLNPSTCSIWKTDIVALRIKWAKGRNHHLTVQQWLPTKIATFILTSNILSERWSKIPLSSWLAMSLLASPNI